MAATVVAITAALAVAAWDGRSPFRRMIDAQEGRVSMVAMLADAPGEVLWIGGDTEAWLLADRAEWSNDLQGAGMVFSRPLAVDWNARTAALVDLGLARVRSRRLSASIGQGAPVRPTRAAIAALCARPDAPAAIVLPGQGPAGGPPFQSWRPSQPRFHGYGVNGGYAWRRVSVYSVIPCAATLIPLRP